MNIQSSIGTLADRAVNAGAFALNEVKEAGENDPALAMRIAATMISPEILTGVGQPIQDSFQKTIVPMVRGGLLALDLYRAHRTFKAPGSSLAEKGLDTLRVATDLVGFAGGIIGFVSPQLKATGDSMMGFAYAADVVSHAIRGLEHGANRVKVWNEIRRKKSHAEGPLDKDKSADKAPTAPPIAAPPQASIVSAPTGSGLFVAPTSTAQQYLSNMTSSTAPIAQVG